MKSTLLSSAEFLSSPHCSERPAETEISLLVIHGISLPPKQFSGQFVEAFFLGQLDHQLHPYFETIKDLRVSSHLYIRRDGKIIQFVPFSMCAWHAGVSSFRGRDRCNEFSIGIELEGDDHIAYRPVQYQVLATVTKELMQRFPKITLDRIVGHKDIAPGRKTDPGDAFDWDKYYALIR